MNGELLDGVEVVLVDGGEVDVPDVDEDVTRQGGQVLLGAVAVHPGAVSRRQDGVIVDDRSAAELHVPGARVEEECHHEGPLAGLRLLAVVDATLSILQHLSTAAAATVWIQCPCKVTYEQKQVLELVKTEGGRKHASYVKVCALQA